MLDKTAASGILEAAGRVMADKTDKRLRNMVVYQVYVRNHTNEGTFKALEADLDRIRNLGADMIHLLPVHPIGTQNRKGSLGSPYAISDYRAINPELGTADDFTSLVNAIHKRGMKCIMDIVYNHTSPDSYLARHHPDWFYKKPGNVQGNKIGDWWDVIDLDYSNPASGLWEYQIETLKIWARTVDGFRCDVAPLVPLEFWIRAREEVAAVRPDCIWIAESVEPSFILENRARGFVCHSDAEMFRAFDVCYDYDIFGCFKKYLEGAVPLSAYAEKINAQEYSYPDNYVKLRCLENHDQSRAAFSVPDEKALRNWTAFTYFQKGLTLIYGGQEWVNDFRPSLFDKDPVFRENRDNVRRNEKAGAGLTALMQDLYRIKKESALTDSSYTVTAAGGNAAGRSASGDVLIAVHRPKTQTGGSCTGNTGTASMAGVFSFTGWTGPVALNSAGVPDGIYTNLLDGSSFRVEAGRISLRGEPVIFTIPFRA
jgi:glycosidase